MKCDFRVRLQGALEPLFSPSLGAGLETRMPEDAQPNPLEQNPGSSLTASTSCHSRE